MLSINTYMHPFRLNLKDKAPVELKIELKNRSDEDKMVSVVLDLPKALSLDKSGISSDSEKRLGMLKPKEEKVLYYQIYPKNKTGIGRYTGELKLNEHYRNYNYVIKEYKKKIEVKVEE